VTNIIIFINGLTYCKQRTHNW